MIDKNNVINKVKILSNTKKSNDDISVFVDLSEYNILSYTNRKELLDEMEYVLIEYTVYLLRENERDGLTSINECGVNMSYDTSIPNSLKSSLNSYILCPLCKII